MIVSIFIKEKRIWDFSLKRNIFEFGIVVKAKTKKRAGFWDLLTTLDFHYLGLVKNK